ncbi:hypothetical protein WUBG_06119, partial [Wuchereria bancrofti]
EHLDKAQEYFSVVGKSATECDTITGRQAMASSYFLSNQFDEVLVYLDSIKTYFHDDDTFNFNIGQALLACGNSLKAEASLLLVVDEELRLKPTYFLALLVLVGDYLYSAKSFDSMERIEPNPEYWEGKRGAIIGVFKLVIEQKAPLDHLREAMILLERSRHPQNSTSKNLMQKSEKVNDGKNASIAQTSAKSAKVGMDWRIFENDPCKQVFANRSVYLQKIRYYGFDMDFTLAIYKSPEYDILLYSNIINRLILLGYPEQLRCFPYEQDFVIRGLWFDRNFGNLLKVDGFGNILVGIHGYNYLRRSDIKKHYPNKFISLRHLENVLVMNSLFDIAHTYVLTTLIHYFDNHKDYERTSDGTGVRNGDTIISYKSLAEDVLSAVNYVHNDSSLKTDVLQNLDKYIIKDNRIKPLLQLINAHGGRTFLLTNSNYSYTNGILSYLIGPDWTSYFDVSIVDAKKPLWFMKGTVFRQIDTDTGAPKIGVHQGLLKKGDVMLA